MNLPVHARRTRARRGQGELLRSEILEATETLLLETRDESQVSVRAIADRVGVSTPSLYLHFADKQELLDAVCEKVFDDLERSMAAAAAEATHPFEALRLRGTAYVRFGLENPEHYRILMMARRDSDSGAHSLVASTAFGHFVEAVQACIDSGVFVDISAVEAAMCLWAAAHGITSLLIAKPHFPWPPAEEIGEAVVKMAGIGLAAGTRLAGCEPTEVAERLDRLR